MINALKINEKGQTEWKTAAFTGKTELENLSNLEIAQNGEGQIFLAWNKAGSRPPYSNPVAWAQKLDKEGNRLWDKEGVTVFSASTYRAQWFPQVVPDSLGGIIIVSVNTIPGFLNLSEENRICAQRIDSSGNKLWGEAGILIGRER